MQYCSDMSIVKPVDICTVSPGCIVTSLSEECSVCPTECGASCFGGTTSLYVRVMHSVCFGLDLPFLNLSPNDEYPRDYNACATIGCCERGKVT